VRQTDPNLPTVLLHHTPTRTKEAAEAGIALMVSGHTHGGQLWPVGYLFSLFFGVKQGLSYIGEMKIYLTNGVGTWGPPVRVLAAPEVVIFTLTKDT